ncbi:MAG: helix-turn-helix domain-containing protein [Gemmatimonadaceae bacterium]
MGTTTQTAATGAGVVSRPRLLAAAPIVAVSDELSRHVADLTRLAPASDATTALTLYRDKLAAALHRARELDLFVSADVASVILGKSASMVQHLCRSGALRAKKVGGTWQIDRVDLERLRSD